MASLPIISVPYARAERSTMPQITDARAFMHYLASRGIRHRTALFDPHQLRAVQGNVNLEKVVGIAGAWDSHDHIIIAVDSRIMDGHHRWWAARFLNSRVRAIQVYAPHTTLIRIANNWSGVVHHGIA